MAVNEFSSDGLRATHHHMNRELTRYDPWDGSMHIQVPACISAVENFNATQASYKLKSSHGGREVPKPRSQRGYDCTIETHHTKMAHHM